MPEGKYLEGGTAEGVEAVRLRPHLYVGPPEKPEALTSLILEALCLAVDEATGGPAKNVTVTLVEGDTVLVSNDGPGLPLGGDVQGLTYIEAIMTRLHACRDLKNREANRRWCGVGVAVLCALTEFCVLRVEREGALWEQTFERGKPKGPIARLWASKETGTYLKFRPDRSILFSQIDAQALKRELERFSAEVPCVATELFDLRTLNLT